MVFVYILGKVETGKDLEVFNSLKRAKQVKKVSLIYGIYDFCIEVRVQTMEELDDFLFKVVRKTQGVKDTITLVTSKTVSKKD